MDDESNGECFGEYGSRVNCPTCRFAGTCKQFTNAEREVSIRNQGKYKGRGKERPKNKY